MRKDERGASTRPDARMTCEGDMSKVEVRTLPVRGLAVTERPQRGRKKPHWRVSPSTRVRVRQRIRRWDGYLYNIDLFPYVEHRLLAFIEG